MEKHGTAVYIGRFQPPHQTHLDTIRKALDESKKLVLIIGSAKAAPSIRNPFSCEERVDMISACLPPEDLERIKFVGVRDYHYNEMMWLTEVQQAVAEAAAGDPSIALYGTYKDSSSYYVSMFPQWEFVPTNFSSDDSSTSVRTRMFEEPVPAEGWTDRGLGPWHGRLPEGVREYIERHFVGNKARGCERANRFFWLQKEYAFLKKYKEKWKGSPFPPTFVTVDSVVTASGHVLLVRRGHEPGKGLYALPGGFIRESERLEDAAVRELREETRISLDAPLLKRYLTGNKVFDHPGRSLRGRTITHAFHFNLGAGPLPAVKGADDADKAMWVPIADALKMEDQFFEDHWHMLFFFCMQTPSVGMKFAG